MESPSDFEFSITFWPTNNQTPILVLDASHAFTNWQASELAHQLKLLVRIKFLQVCHCIQFNHMALKNEKLCHLIMVRLKTRTILELQQNKATASLQHEETTLETLEHKSRES